MPDLSVSLRHPARWFWAFALAHLALWTLIPWLVSSNPPLDVIEGFAWGREWMIGGPKHPLMQAWILESLAWLTGRASGAPFLASQLAIVATFWAVWQTGRRIADDATALVGVMLLEGVAYYTFTALEFNPNVLQLPFGALTCWAFYRAVRDNRWVDWSALGVFAAGGLYAKYSVGLLLVVLGGLMLYAPEARRRLREKGPWLALAIFFIVLSPQIVWLAAHDFMPFSYAGTRLEIEGTSLAWAHLLSPLTFFRAQLLALLGGGLLLLLVTGFRWPRGALRSEPFDRVFLHAITWGPLVVLLLLSAATGFRPRDMWGSCLWNFVGLWFALRISPRFSPASVRRFLIGTFSLLAFSAIGYGVGMAYLTPYFLKKPMRVHFPGRELSAQINRAWEERTHTPLAYAIGDTWTAGNVAYFAPHVSFHDRPHVFINGKPEINPWIDVNDVAQKGGVILWWVSEDGSMRPMPKSLKQRFPNAEPQPPVTLDWQTSAPLPPLVLQWAILPPMK